MGRGQDQRGSSLSCHTQTTPLGLGLDICIGSLALKGHMPASAPYSLDLGMALPSHPGPQEL